MLRVSNLSLSFSHRKLFTDVNLIFQPGNIYGVIGANGAGKSTFLRVLSGEQEIDTGSISKDESARIAVLRQDQNMFDEHSVLETVLMGHEQLYTVMKARDEIYQKTDFTEEDGLKAAEYEDAFGSMGGWEAEAEAGTLLKGLGLSDEMLTQKMSELEPGEKVRILLAQSLFGTPDILLMDEPTNGLDLESIQWLEDFLLRFNNIAIIVSHNRHFLNMVCTHTLDIDFGSIRSYVGNYDFWFEASQLMRKQKKQEEKKTEKLKEQLQEFIQRFASHKARARQASSRKKLLEKLDIEQLPQSTRRFPYFHFEIEKECGKSVLEIKNLALSHEGKTQIHNFSLLVEQEQKIAFVGSMNISKKLLFEALAGKLPPDEGSIHWGQTISSEYFPGDNSSFFKKDSSIFDWLSGFTESKDVQYIRGFLGKLLFSGDEIFKSIQILSGGEKARCMYSKIMLQSPNVIILDEPTNHLDLEAISALNKALIQYKGVLLFNSHDHQFIDTIANRIIEFTPNGIIDRLVNFTDYLADPKIQALRDKLYGGKHRKIYL